eukprot:TRINITY_DN1257_c4_g1_i1.p1 TRINITY_DN1257_c4_g1~~TRINITY_DN1257_c4_g1_i1.p1  ORF type:complete len:593 (+),score=104.81 TRINITY_DN1257_c4_g1_i1:68-1780(+)
MLPSQAFVVTSRAIEAARKPLQGQDVSLERILGQQHVPEVPAASAEAEPTTVILAASSVGFLTALAAAKRHRNRRSSRLQRRCAGGEGRKQVVTVVETEGTNQEDIERLESMTSVAAAVDAQGAVVKKQGQGEEEEEEDAPPERILMVVLIAAAYVVWTMDKVNMSVSIIPMMQQYGWGPSETGLIQSALFWGYASTQVLGGFLATKFGGKRVLLGAVVLWSLMTAVAPIAASMSTSVFIASRVLVGLGEGLAPAAGCRLVATWFPESERSRATAAVGSGSKLGSVIGLLISPLIINAYGWPAVFYIFGGLGLAWAAVWAVLGKDREDLQPRIATKQPAAAAAAAEAEDKEEEDVPWQEILSTPALWAIVIAHFCHDWGMYALLSWTPTYLNKALNFDLTDSADITIIPSVAAIIMAGVAGTTADTLLGSGWKLTDVRKTCQGLAFLGPAICLGTLATLSSGEHDYLPILLLVAGIGSASFSYSGLYSSHSDLNAKYSGLVNGISTTFGATAGLLSNLYAGRTLDATGSWAQAIFLPSIACYFVGVVAYTLLYDAKPLDWDAQAAAKKRQ